MSYSVQRPARSRHLLARHLRHHLLEWGEPQAGRAPLVLLHGWMDVAASFQFVVDALRAARHVLAPDWRGFGGTQGSAVDAYWYPDYLGDLDALLDALSPHGPVDLVAHSMGGNVAMLYAGVRPARVRRLVNLEGYGLPEPPADEAPRRYARWLDELKAPATLHSYADADAVAARLRKNNPRLAPERAAWLARQWAAPGADGRWHLRADPAHKRVNPVLYRKEEALACWRRIEAPVLWVEGELTAQAPWWGARYPRAEFEARLAQVPRLQRARVAGSGHMLHHDQPQAVAALIEGFIDAP